MSSVNYPAGVPPKLLDTADILAEEFEALRRPGQAKLPDPPQPEFDEALPPLIGEGQPAMAQDRAEATNTAQAFTRYATGVHALPGTGRSALCLSGGGIRSAAFSLGVVQALARRGLLSQMDYLSTVSGGGYTGAWLTAWTHRAMTDQPAAPDFTEIERQLGSRTSVSGSERAPMQWLRGQQKFLSPRSGLGSGDLWAPISIFVRDLLLNWLVFVPMLAAVLLLPRLAWFAVDSWSYLSMSDHPAVPWLLLNWWDPQKPPNGVFGWGDAAGALLVSIGFGVASYYRTNGARLSGRDPQFKRLVLAPVLAGSFVLVMAIGGWLRGPSGDSWKDCLEWASLVPIVLVIGRLVVAALNSNGRGKWTSQDAGVVVVELGGLIVAGAITGVLIWSGVVWLKSWDPKGDFRTLTACGVPWLLTAYLLGQVLFAGLTSRLPRGMFDREWLARASGYYMLASVLWLLASGIVLFEPEEVDTLYVKAIVPLAAVSGTMTIGVGLSQFTKATAAAAAVKERLSLSLLTRLSCLVFCVTMAVLLAHATADLIALLFHGVVIARKDPPHTQTEALQALWVSAAACLGLIAFSTVATLVVNVNEFSLHTLYANRLIRTFLGASNTPDITGRDTGRNSFDGFSPSDNLAMGELWRDKAGVPRREGPFPVVGVALNLVASDNPAWQERKAAPFVVTPLHTGADLVGYRDSRLVAGGISLGMAMAISGAAASPNFGYHSSPLVSFVLMLFNVRLGWWMGNPNHPNRWRFRSPLFSLRLFQQEALGRTSADQPFVYLSDGGHFDNLGLYEMVRRRARTIVVVDATADPECHMDDLGRTLRSISVDLGVEILFNPSVAFRKRSDPETAGVYCAVGHVTYPEKDAQRGTLIFIKAGLYKDAPADIRAYAASNARFPHDATFNQWFTETQFESYRALGSHVIDVITGPERPMTLAALLADARRYVNTVPA